MNLQPEHTSLTERLDQKRQYAESLKKETEELKKEIEKHKKETEEQQKKTEILQQEYDMVRVQLDKKKDELIQQYKKRYEVLTKAMKEATKMNSDKQKSLEQLGKLLKKRPYSEISKEIEIPKHENDMDTIEIKADKCLPDRTEIR